MFDPVPLEDLQMATSDTGVEFVGLWGQIAELCVTFTVRNLRELAVDCFQVNFDL